ncbi:MAG TPA: lactonase family protein [Acidobacteriaceae bacterium]|nr:lactonase family protein [Acidobacteriaceae bacterium]
MTMTVSRRSFLASSIALPWALRSLAQHPAGPRWVFLGTDKGPGIMRCAWDAVTGKLGAAELAIKSEHSGFFALHPRLPRLYVANELNGVPGVVSVLDVNAAAGTLELAGKQSTMGEGPCYVSVDKTGRNVFAANYAGGSFAAFDLGKDGSLKPATGTLDCRNNPECGTHGPVAKRQEAAHLHCANVAPGNDFVLSCNLGNDSIEVFPIHPGEADPLGKPQRFSARAGSGPRHIAFHPNRRWVYIIHELDCTVELFDWSVAGGAASLKRRDGSAISTLGPGEPRAGSSGCEILVSPNGRFVYTCTRGTDSLQVFGVDARTGRLTEQQRLPCGGKVPRHIAFDPTHRWLLVANQVGSSVTVFSNDARTGKLSGPVQTLAADTPMFVQFI